MALAYKKNENGNIEADDKGNPLVFDDAKEDSEAFGLDAIHLFSKVPALQEESKKHRLKAKDAEESLLKFDPIKDMEITDIQAALEKVKSLKAGDLTKTEEVERLKKETEEAWRIKLEAAEKAYDSKLDEASQTVKSKDDTIYRLTVSNRFAASAWFAGEDPKTILTPGIAESHFRDHFKVEDGKMIAYDNNGEMIYSRERPGEPANFDEAMSSIIDAYPDRDRILKAPAGGSGTGFNVGGGRFSVKTKTDLKTPADKAEFIGEHGLDAWKKLPKT